MADGGVSIAARLVYPSKQGLIRSIRGVPGTDKTGGQSRGTENKVSSAWRPSTG